MTHTDLKARAREWLSAGGLFNPELMAKQETTDLVRDLVEALDTRTRTPDTAPSQSADLTTEAEAEGRRLDAFVTLDELPCLYTRLAIALRAAEAREKALREVVDDGLKLLTHPQMAQSTYVECGDMYLDIDLWVDAARRALGGSNET